MMRKFFFLSLVLASMNAHAVLPQTGWWWNPAEGGSGLNIQVQRAVAGDAFVFAAGFVYDDDGNPVWFVTSGVMEEMDLGGWNETGLVGSFSGVRFESEGGSCLTCAYIPPITTEVPGSEVRFDFTDTRNMTATFDGFSRDYQFFDISNNLAAGIDLLDGTRAYVSATIRSGMVNGSLGNMEVLFTDTSAHTVQAAIRKASTNELSSATLSDLDDEVFFVEVAGNDGVAEGPALAINAFSGEPPAQPVLVVLAITYDRETNTAHLVLPRTNGAGLDFVNSHDNFPRFRAFVTEDAIVGFAIPPMINNWEPQDEDDIFGNNLTLGSTIVIYRTEPDDINFMIRN